MPSNGRPLEEEEEEEEEYMAGALKNFIFYFNSSP
jgi:hypothetical protein